MMFFISLMVIMTVFVLGMKVQTTIYKYSLNNEQKKIISEKNQQFNEILENLRTSIFRSRVNTTVYIQGKSKKHGDVDIIYIMDKPDIAIFKNDTCLYTSDSVDKDIINKIIESINIKFRSKINDVVEVLGFTFYREDFEKTFGGKFKNMKFDSLIQEDELDSIIKENSKKFDVDEILDKISKFGVNSLTLEERIFLDNYGKKD